MKRQFLRQSGAVLAMAALPWPLALVPNAARAATWQSSDRWGTWNNGGYILYNNIWGNGYGPQTIWANSFSNWGVWANHPATGGIKSYPNVTRRINKRISALQALSATVRATTPPGGAWASTFDIWDVDLRYEIMLWLNHTGTADGGGNVKPISYNYNAQGKAVPVYTNVDVGGSTWNVYRGSNGANQVFSFLRTTKTNHVTVDLRAILNWLRLRGWMGDVTVGDVQYGFEITSTAAGGSNYNVQSYSVSVR